MSFTSTVRSAMRHRPHAGARRAPVVAASGGAVEPHVLELRIHGISNTPPALMLEVPEDAIEKVEGDTLGSFWSLTPKAAAAARALPENRHDHVPPEVRREAYSWGAQARSTPSAPGAAATVAARLSRAGWILLVPLGLANAAYWSRKLDRNPAKFASGAMPVRMFGLILTLLVVVGVSTVSLDLVATQCFADAAARCTVLPGPLGSLDELSWSRRLALLSLVPLAVLALLVWLSRGSRVRYEQATSAAVRSRPCPTERSSSRTASPAEAEEMWTLADPGLWSRWCLTGAMEGLHFAGGTSVVVVIVAAAQVRSASQGVALVTFAVLGGAAAILLVAAGALVASAEHKRAYNRPDPDTKQRWRSRARRVIVAAVVVLVATLVGLCLPWEDTARTQTLGMSVIPWALVGLALLTVLTAPTWRGAPRRKHVATVGALVAGVPMALLVLHTRIDQVHALAEDTGAIEGPVAQAGDVLGRVARSVDGMLTEHQTLLRLVLLGGVLVVVAAWAVPGLGSTPQGRRDGWWGAAPAVFLALSLGVVVMLTSLLTVAAGDWLNAGDAAQCLEPPSATTDAGATPTCGVPESPAAGAAVPPVLTLPAPYLRFSTVLVVSVLVLVVVGLVCLVLRYARDAHLRGHRTGSRHRPAVAEAFVGCPTGPLEEQRAADYGEPMAAGRLADLVDREDLLSARRDARRRASALKRAELAVFALAVAVVVPVGIVATPGLGMVDGLLQPLVAPGLWSVALLWTGLVLRAVTQAGTGRPLGLLWDLMCFLPRTAHPFGPPCYAERAVPEIAQRVAQWLDGEPAPDGHPGATSPRPRRVVVLSAHSLGAVLAVAALFTQERGRAAGSVGLLTYGTQLRPYFGRFFPELLGPDVLGTAPCARATLGSTDPVTAIDVERDPGLLHEGTALHESAKTALTPGDDTLVSRLGMDTEHPRALPAWLSLWRATDPLGMPAVSGAPNDVDRAAEEIDATGFVALVGAHGGYPRTIAYRRAFAEVTRRVEARRAVQRPAQVRAAVARTSGVDTGTPAAAGAGTRA